MEENIRTMRTLEKFIQDNREAFDSEEPSMDLWQKIDQNLPAKPVVRPLWFQQSMMRYAAAALIVLTVGWGVYQLGRHSRDTELAINQPPVNLQHISPELVQAEMYYTSLIQDQKTLLNPAELQSLGLKDDFSKDLRTLDSLYINLKQDLLTDPNTDQIVAAMVQNLQLRVELLKEQIQTLQRARTYRRNQTQLPNEIPNKIKKQA